MKDQSTCWARVTSTPLTSFRPVDESDKSAEAFLLASASPISTIDVFAKQGLRGTKILFDVNNNSEQASLCDTIASSLSEDEDEVPIPCEIEFMAISRQLSTDSDVSWHERGTERPGESDLLGLQFVTEDIPDHHHEFMSVQSVGSVTNMSECGSFTTIF